MAKKISVIAILTINQCLNVELCADTNKKEGKENETERKKERQTIENNKQKEKWKDRQQKTTNTYKRTAKVEGKNREKLFSLYLLNVMRLTPIKTENDNKNVTIK